MNRKIFFAVIVSVLSLAIASVCVTLLICEYYTVGVSVDLGATVVSICTGLIGVCATIMVGLQIWNHIEFREVRDKINKIDEIETAFTDKSDDICDLIYTTLYTLGSKETDPNTKLIQYFLAAKIFECQNENSKTEDEKKLMSKNLLLLYKLLFATAKKASQTNITEDSIEKFSKKVIPLVIDKNTRKKISQLQIDISSVLMKLRQKTIEDRNKLNSQDNAKTKDAQPK